MIIKKPYAFLIKHFKMIHLIIFALVTYIAYKSTTLLSFFNDYAKNGFYSYVEDLTSAYINVYMFIVLVIIVLLGVIIYILLRWKDKKRTLYIFLCSFYIILFVVFIVYFGALTSIQDTIMDIRTVRVFRDIILIATLPQYFFLVLSLIRGIGFDIKKFDFGKDIEELQIEAPDEEEVEITFGKNTYKVKRRFRRILRELKYYALENKFFFGVICSLIVVSLCFVIYLNFEVYNKKYSENDIFIVDGVSFNVLESYGSNVDYKGDLIVSDKEYILLKINVKNLSDERKVLQTEDLKLMVDNEGYTATFSKNNHFIDLGEGYANQTLYPGEEYQYLLVFEIPYKKMSSSYMFRMINHVDYLRGEINANHKDVLVAPIYMNNVKFEENYNKSDIIDLGVGTLPNSTLLVMNYEVNDTYTVNYNYCVKSECFVGKKILKADQVGTIPMTVMKLEIDYTMNKDLYIYKYVKKTSDLINLFGKLTYKINGVSKTTSLKVFSYDYLSGRDIYVQVPNEIKSASDIDLNINVRHARFNVQLKKEV